MIKALLLIVALATISCSQEAKEAEVQSSNPGNVPIKLTQNDSTTLPFSIDANILGEAIPGSGLFIIADDSIKTFRLLQVVYVDSTDSGSFNYSSTYDSIGLVDFISNLSNQLNKVRLSQTLSNTNGTQDN